MARYGSGDEETVITEYLDSHLEGGIRQKNLDKILDMIDIYVEIEENRKQLNQPLKEERKNEN